MYSVYRLRGLLEAPPPETAVDAYQAISAIKSVLSYPVLIAQYSDFEEAKKSMIGSGFIIRRSPKSKYYDVIIRYISAEGVPCFFSPEPPIIIKF